MKIIGVAGTNGSGKDTVGQVLAEHGWLFVSVTELLRKELSNRGLPIERENMRGVGDEWRRRHGLGVLVDKAVEIYQNEKDNYEGLVIASLRNPGEADRIHELGGTVVWVDAEPQIRYERVLARGRGAEDQKSFRQFISEEQAETIHSGDEATLSMADVEQRADIFLENNGSDVEAFKAQIEKVLNL